MIKYSLESELDELDRSILQLVQKNGRISHVEIGERIGLSPPAVHARVKRLEQRGLIQRYVALLNRERIGYDMLCFINVSLQLHQQEQVEQFHQAILEMPEVLECHHLTGEYDYLLKVVVRNRQALQQFVVKKLTPVPGIARIHTSLVLTEIKSTTALPV